MFINATDFSSDIIWDICCSLFQNFSCYSLEEKQIKLGFDSHGYDGIYIFFYVLVN